MAARLVSSVYLRDAAGAGNLEVPGEPAGTYDWFNFVQQFSIRDTLGDFGRDPSQGIVELVPGCGPVVASPVYFSRRRIVRINFDDASFEEFRVVRFDRELSGQTPPRLTLRPIWLDLADDLAKRTLADGTVTYTWYRIGVGVSTALSAIMENAPSNFAAGTVDGSFSGITVSIAAAGSSFLELLRALCAAVAQRAGATCEWDVRWDGVAGKYKIDLVPFVGGTIDHPIEGPTGGTPASEGNRQALLKSEDAQKYFSRVVGLAGPDGEQITIGQATWAVSGAVYSAPNTTLTLSANPIYVTNSPGITGVQFGNATQGWFSLVSTSPPGTVVVSGDASALNGQSGRFRLSTGADLTYVADPAAESTAGVTTLPLVRSDIASASNLLVSAGVSADFSTWSAGLPIGWSKTTGLTVTEETDERYVQSGTKSARCSGNEAEAIYCGSVSFTAGTANPYLSTWIAVRVLSGRIRFEIEDVATGALYPTDDGEKAEAQGDTVRALSIGGQAPGTGTYRIRVSCVTDSTEFVLDSATLTQSPAPFEYTPDMGPEALMHVCGAKLALEGGIQPDQYEGDWFDLSYLAGATEDEAAVGAKVQLKDAASSGAFTVNIETRLVELQRQYHGASFERRGRLGSRAVDVTAFLSDGLRRRTLTDQQTPPVQAPTFTDAHAYINATGDLVLSYKLNSPNGLSIAHAYSTTAQPSRQSVIEGTHPNYAVQNSAEEDELVIIAAIATDPEDHVYFTAVAFSGASAGGFPGEMFQIHLRVSMSGGQITDGSIIASKLTTQGQRFSSNIVFSAPNQHTVNWGAGTIELANGSVYSIASGTTNMMSVLTYVYLAPAVSTTALQVSTTYSDVVGDDVILVCVAKPSADGYQQAFFVPAVGVLGINESNLSVYSVGATIIKDSSISTAKLQAGSVVADKIAAGAVVAGKIAAGAVSTNELAANSVTAAKISVVSLSAISADLGTVTAGHIRNSGNTAAIRLSGTATLPTTNFIDFTATGSDPFLKHPGLTLEADGDANFGGTVSAAAFTASAPVFSGEVSFKTGLGFVTSKIGGSGFGCYQYWGIDDGSLNRGNARLEAENGGAAFFVYDGDGSTKGTRTLSLGNAKLGFFSTTPVSKPTVTGSRGSNAALASALTALSTLGLLTDSSSA